MELDLAMESSLQSFGERSNKRPRSSTPTKQRGSLDLAGTADTSLSRDDARAMNLRDGDVAKRNAELNELLQLSANHEVNFSMQSDAILRALAEIVIVDCLQWKEPSSGLKDEPFIIFRSVNAWKRPPTTRMEVWAEHCCNLQIARRVEAVKTCEAVAMILRNFSYTGANLRLLAYSPDILHVLTAFLYIGAKDESYRVSCSEATLPLTALQTLLHLVRYLDVTGQQLLTDKLFYEDGSGYGPAVPNAVDFGKCVTGEWGGFGACWLAKRLDTREDTIENVPTEFLLSLTADYLVAVWSIFPALKEVVVDVRSPRPVVLLSLDLLQELINTARVGLVGAVQEEDSNITPGQDYNMPTIRAVLVNLPDSMLERLTDLLYIPRLGPDSLDYVDPVCNMVTRVTTLKLLMGYNATVDADARDRALDVLVPLLELDSPRMAARLGTDSSGIRTRLYDALVPILTTNVGRNEASVLATQLIRELAQASDENKLGLQYVQSRLVELACRDARVSQLVWNDLYPVPTDDGDDDEDEGRVESS